MLRSPRQSGSMTCPSSASSSFASTKTLVGYLAMRGGVTRHSALNDSNKPNVNEAFFVAREVPPITPMCSPASPYRCANRWPQDLPGFREACLAYAAALEKLALRLVPLYALALNLPETHLTRPSPARCSNCA
jgi:isopenicillin N synthase-like dioxygenase